MLPPDERSQVTDALESLAMQTTQTTDALENLAMETTQTTDALERLPRPSDRRHTASERRQQILQQRQTDVLPGPTTETPGSRLAWRQATQLREENKHLHTELERVRTALAQLTEESSILRTEFDKEVEIIHNGHQQEIEQYHNHLHEMMDERNKLQEKYQVLEQRYEEMERSFHDAVAEQAGKILMEAAQDDELAPAATSSVLAGLRKVVEAEVRREEEKHLVEALYLKREAQRVFALLEQERKELEEERQRLYTLQNSAREQAELRQKVLQTRLDARWRASIVACSLIPLFLLVVLQFVCMNLFHVYIAPSISLALLAPILICIIWTIVSASPAAMITHMYYSAPHKRKIKK